MTPSAAQRTRRQMTGWLANNGLEVMLTESVSTNSICRGISIEGLKGHKREDSRSLGRNLNQKSPMQETGVLPTRTWHSIECYTLQVNVCPKLNVVPLINNLGFRYEFRAVFSLKQSQNFDFTALVALVTITGRVRCNHNFLKFDLQVINFVSEDS
jgi:hypothetical protein